MGLGYVVLGGIELIGCVWFEFVEIYGIWFWGLYFCGYWLYDIFVGE